MEKKDVSLCKLAVNVKNWMVVASNASFFKSEQKHCKGKNVTS